MSTLSTFSSGYNTSSCAAAAPKRSSLFRRLLDRLIETRMRKAEEVIRQHSHLLPDDLERVGWKITQRGEDSLPFVR